MQNTALCVQLYWVQGSMALPPHWKVPPGYCRLSPVRLSGDDNQWPGGTFHVLVDSW